MTLREEVAGVTVFSPQLPLEQQHLTCQNGPLGLLKQAVLFA